MNTKLFEVLKTKCKSFGLTKKALEELTELASSELTDESTDEEIAAKADLLVPYAKAMQGEITRKTRKSSTKKQSEDEGDGEDESDTEMPAWFKQYQQSNDQRIAALEKENNDLKAEKAATERATTIADKAKKLGIPEFMVKRIIGSIAEDADVDAELANFKQELVNNSLRRMKPVKLTSRKQKKMRSRGRQDFPTNRQTRSFTNFKFQTHGYHI